MAVVIMVLIPWAVRHYSQAPPPLSAQPDMAPPGLDIPGEDVTIILDRGIRLMDSPPESGELARVDFSFLPRFAAVPQDYTPPALGLIFIGSNIRFTAVNDQIYAEGEIMPGGETILSINNHGVLVSSPPAGRRLLPWRQTRAVSLER